MPTYSETKALLSKSSGDIAVIKANIQREKVYTGGYKTVVRLNRRSANIDVSLKGPKQLINQIPEGVLIKHAQVLNKIRKWLNDEESDFPAL